MSNFCFYTFDLISPWPAHNRTNDHNKCFSIVIKSIVCYTKICFIVHFMCEEFLHLWWIFFFIVSVNTHASKKVIDTNFNRNFIVLALFDIQLNVLPFIYVL